MTITLNGTTGVTTPGVTDTGALSVTGISTLGALGSSVITSGTAVASTSGTSIDFTGIPSWVKRITVMFGGVSTNGTSNVQVQVGAGSVATTGYNSAAMQTYSTGPIALTQSTASFLATTGWTAVQTLNGSMTITLLGSNTWTSTANLEGGTGFIYLCAGKVALGGTLDRVRITTVNGTDTFDAGSINILYE